MKILTLLMLITFSFSASSAYLIEDHLKLLSSRKRAKKWTLKDFVTGKKKARTLPKVNVTPKNIKENPKSELSLGVEYGNLDVDTDGVEDSNQVFRGSLTAFVRFVGVLGNFYLNEDPFENHGDLSLALRLAGNSQQSTHLMLFYGINRTKELDSGTLTNIENHIWGGELVLYFLDAFAGSYKLTNMEENREDNVLLRRSGRRHEIRAFLDFQYMRLFGSHILEILEFQNTTFARRESRGIMGGVSIFF